MFVLEHLGKLLTETPRIGRRSFRHCPHRPITVRVTLQRVNQSQLEKQFTSILDYEFNSTVGKVALSTDVTPVEMFNS